MRDFGQREIVTEMADEKLYDFLERRERELTHQIAALRSDLEMKENELTHVMSAKRQINNLGAADKQRFGVPPEDDPLESLAKLIHHNESNRAALAELSEQATIKQLILKALWMGFRDKGATAAQIRQFIVDVYGRNIHPSSMSPQLSRLKADHLIKQKEGEIWRLTLVGGHQAQEIGSSTE
jgi:hypothetical protein